MIGGFFVNFYIFLSEQSIVAIFYFLEFITAKVSLGCYVFLESTFNIAVPNSSYPTSQCIMISVSGDLSMVKS